MVKLGMVYYCLININPIAMEKELPNMAMENQHILNSYIITHFPNFPSETVKLPKGKHPSKNLWFPHVLTAFMRRSAPIFDGFPIMVSTDSMGPSPMLLTHLAFAEASSLYDIKCYDIIIWKKI